MHAPSLSPSREVFKALAREATLVPVWTERLADHDTPVSAFARLAPEGHAFLLESVQGGERWAAYSFLGCDPLVRVVGRRGDVRVEGLEALAGHHRAQDPLEVIEGLKAQLRLPSPEALGLAGGGARPVLMAGFVGALGYDLVRAFERLPPREVEASPEPELDLMLPGTVVVFDTLRQVLRVVRNVYVPPGADLDQAYDAATEALAQALARLEGPLPPPAPRPEVATGGDPALAGFQPQVSRARFEAGVEAAREHILAGDCIQVVLSQRLKAPRDVAPFDVYRALRTTNPSPYMYYLRLPERAGQGALEVAGASPEVLVRLEGDEVVVRPIAGTRPRGQTPAEDQALEAELRADPKELAEHVMLVDLGRNDVGRVAAPGSVRVVEQLVVERYSHVMHLVSEVRGRLAEGRGALDVIRAAFPAGTLSGAPKVKAMEIIDAHEPQGRGLYGGAVGYLGLDGGMDLCICIRTLVADEDEMWCQAGAGVVLDSRPEAEYEETLNKMRSVLRAVELARRGLRL